MDGRAVKLATAVTAPMLRGATAATAVTAVGTSGDTSTAHSHCHAGSAGAHRDCGHICTNASDGRAVGDVPLAWHIALRDPLHVRWNPRGTRPVTAHPTSIMPRG